MSAFTCLPLPRAGHRRFGVLLAACFLWTAVAEAEGPLRLEDVRRSGRLEAPRILAEVARVDAAREDAARAAQLPDPVLTVGIDDLTATGEDAFRIGADEMTQRRIGLMQDWPSRRKRAARQAAADARIAVAEGDMELARLDSERQAGEAWVAVWAAEADRRLLDEVRAQSDIAVGIARAHFSAGTGGAADVLAVQAVAAETTVAISRADAQIAAARATLARWVPAQASAEVGALPDFESLRIPIEHLRTAVSQHRGLAAWAGRRSAADSALALAQAEKRPDLGFALSYGARSAGLSDMVMFEVRVGLPLFQRQRQDRDVAARSAEREAAGADQEDAERTHRAELESLLARWHGLLAQNQLLQSELLPLARDRSRVALDAYTQGDRLQPWIDARSAEVGVLRERVQMQADLALAWLQLDTLLPIGFETRGQP